MAQLKYPVAAKPPAPISVISASLCPCSPVSFCSCLLHLYIPVSLHPCILSRTQGSQVLAGDAGGACRAAGWAGTWMRLLLWAAHPPPWRDGKGPAGSAPSATSVTLVALGGMPYPRAAALVGDREMALLLQGCLGSSGPSVVTVGWDKAKDLLGAPWLSTKPHSQPGTPSFPWCHTTVASLQLWFLLFLVSLWGTLELGPWSILEFWRVHCGPCSSSSFPRASPLIFHLLNARAEWGETSSSHSPLYGKLLQTNKQKNPPWNLGERKFHPSLPNNPNPRGGSLARLWAGPAAASQQTSQANRVLSLASSPGLLVGPAGMKLSPLVLLNPSLPPPSLSHPTPYPEVPQPSRLLSVSRVCWWVPPGLSSARGSTLPSRIPFIGIRIPLQNGATPRCPSLQNTNMS